MSYSTIRTAFITITIHLIIPGTPLLLAQDATTPFSSITARLSIHRDIDHTGFHNFWKAGTGLEASLSTPFYLGSVDAGCFNVRFTSREDDVSGFNSLYLFAGWEETIHLPLRLFLSGGIRCGNYFMDFATSDEYTHQIRESELCVSLHTRLSQKVWKNIGWNISFTRMVIYTHKSIRLNFISSGASFSFASPEWLQGLLE